MELTKEYFDQQIAKLATKEDVQDAVDDLARITNDGFGELYRRLDVREQVEEHEREIQDIKRALNIA